MKILEISSGITGIVGFIVTLYFQWQGQTTPRNYIATATLGLIAVFVALRRKGKAESTDASRANISKRNIGASNRIVGDGNQIYVGTAPPAAPQDRRRLEYGFGVMWEGDVPYCPACQDVPMQTIDYGGNPHFESIGILLKLSCPRCGFATETEDDDGSKLTPKEAKRRMRVKMVDREFGR